MATAANGCVGSARVARMFLLAFALEAVVTEGRLRKPHRHREKKASSEMTETEITLPRYRSLEMNTELAPLTETPEVAFFPQPQDSYWDERLFLDEELPTPTSWTDRSYFTDNEGLVCHEGPFEVVEGALALLKAGVLGALYNTTFAHRANDGWSCYQQGFVYRSKDEEYANITAEACYPGLNVSYAGANGTTAFAALRSVALNEYAAYWNMDADRVKTVHACTCHPDSSLREENFMECSDVLNNMTGSWVHRNPADQSAMMCYSGPFLEATFSLAILKSTAQLPMHQYDQIAAAPCSQIGFTHMFQPIDDCFAGLHVWTKEEVFYRDKGAQTAGQVESILFDGPGMSQFEAVYELNDAVLNRIPGCHCSPHGKIGKEMKERCSQKGAASSSPVRAWWVEQ